MSEVPQTAVTLPKLTSGRWSCKKLGRLSGNSRLNLCPILAILLAGWSVFDYNWPVINFLWSADDLGIWWSIHHRSMVYHWATIDWQLADFTGTWSTLNLPTDGRASGDNQVTVARLVGWWPLIHRSSPDWTCLAPDMLWCATLITV